MKKSVLILPLITIALISCNNVSDREKELELREREIALKEKELKLNSSSAKENFEASVSPVETYSAPKKKTEAELKRELYEKECSRASDLLTGNLKYSPKYKNAISMKVKGLKLNCTIRNKASIATFKNIKARVDFKSKTGTTIFSKTLNIYEFIGPKRSINYKTELGITNQQYKDIANFSWTIVDAECR